MKSKTIELIKIENYGKIAVGKSEVFGKRKLEQIVYFKSFNKRDTHSYKPERKDTEMLIIAKQILLELVSGKNI